MFWKKIFTKKGRRVMDLNAASNIVTTDGIIMGYLDDTSEPLVVPSYDLSRHFLAIGPSGSGIVKLNEFISFQQIVNKGGVIWLDSSGSPDEMDSLMKMCNHAGRKDDLLIIAPDHPERSVTYSPIFYGGPEEIATRILSLAPPPENAGGQFYRQSAYQGFVSIIGALRCVGTPYNFTDLVDLITDPGNLERLEHKIYEVAPTSSEAATLRLFLDQFRRKNNDGAVSIDAERLKEVLGGIVGRLFSLTQGKLGEVVNVREPGVNLFDAIRNNKIVYVVLPSMTKSSTASAFGRMVFGDLRSAIAGIQNLPKEGRPHTPYLCFLDELGFYEAGGVARMFELGRTAHVSIMAAAKSSASLDGARSDFFKEDVLGNTRTKVFFKAATNDTAQMIVDLIDAEGNEPGRKEGGEKVTCEMLKGLEIGEAIVFNPIDGVRRIRVPILNP